MMLADVIDVYLTRLRRSRNGYRKDTPKRLQSELETAVMHMTEVVDQ